MSTARIALYGGTFDPIHIGHLIVARAVRERLQIERVIFLPSARPPHKIEARLSEPADRAEMIRLAIEGEPGFEWSDYDLTRRGRTYTIDTVLHFREVLGPQVELFWLIGADSLAELATWHRAAELVELCRIIAAPRVRAEAVDWDRLRPTFSEAQIALLSSALLETPVIDVSATEIRRRVREGRSIRYLVPERVRALVESRGLYRS